MSKTFTSRPAVSRGRGRGNQLNAQPVNRPLGRARPPGTLEGMENSQVGGATGNSNDLPPGVQATPAERRLTYQGGYSVIPPNEKKRQQIIQNAQKEEKALQEHRQRNTQTSFNYVGTVGGGQVSQQESRSHLVQSSPNKVQRQLQQQQRKSFVKQKEEEDIVKHKAKQRAVAETNERRKQEEAASQQQRWDEQKRRTNDAFLRRLENKGKKQGAVNSQGPPQTVQTWETQENEEREENDDEFVQRMGEASMADAEENSADYAGLLVEQRRGLTTLHFMFPQYPVDFIRGILEQTNFSLDAAATVLGE
ncbi:epithelial-stromal interaction protein 1-like [Dreissena polymorpha]|uniref:CUE domain-containing protein n=1 Tax=Dreissena polymorpha TaxID=45954 RepID=A0A9D4GC38_DREPO|nr:epithelial-stromal interaction protein 1-like [Dreissena polymorpha]KAH3814375.1 hypothetical protein DPMN_142871 [Dreissena polymorpha]